MSETFCEIAETIDRLHRDVEALERACRLLRLDPLAGRQWYQLLKQKLLPQLHDDAFLVVAVVGGTNIGKSVIFNHIAGCRASATSPLASGTKHPVCLVPPRFTDRHDLPRIFEGFELHEWADSQAALEDRPEHRLYWQTSEQLPDNLLVLDTPDIDSDAQVNWQRADHIRRCADVLIAVLTQQKYNDAAVKRFFRRSAAEDKAIIVVFNQCQLPEDDQYWPVWLETFCRETNIEPELVYVAPSDRAAAEENRLPFFEKTGLEGTRAESARRKRQPTGAHLAAPVRPGAAPSSAANPGAGSGTIVGEDAGRDLADDLSRLHFAEIKLRTLHGSLRQLLDGASGVPGYLDEIERRSGEFQAAAARLSAESVVKIRDWPTVPNGPMVAEVRQWWRSRRVKWARSVQEFYDAVGRGVSFPFRLAREKLGGRREPPLEIYRQQEWSAVLRAVEELYEKLTWMSESANELLRPSFERLLAGQSRARLLERLRQDHHQVDLELELKDAVDSEMRTFEQDSPELYRFCRQLDNVAAAVRPMTSVVMFSLGWGPAGEVVAPFVADAATQAVAHVAADFVGGTAAAVAGEQAVSGAAGKGAGFLQAKFRKLQTAFTTRRVQWLIARLKELLLGGLPEQFQSAADIPQSDEFRRVAETLTKLQQQLAAQRSKRHKPASAHRE